MKKIYVILGVLAGVYVGVMLIVYGRDYQKEQTELKKSSYILIDNNIRWEYRKGYWYNLNDKDLVKILNENEFQVFENKRKMGTYHLNNYDETWYFFDSKNNSKQIEGKFFGFSGDKTINVLNREPVEMSSLDEEYYRQILNDNKISYEELKNLSTKQKLVYDLDDDGETETIYAVSNVFSNTIYSDKVFSFVYIIDNQKIQLLTSEINEIRDVLSTYSYSIAYIVDINEDRKYELILEGNIFRPNSDCYKMFQEIRGNYKMIKAC